MNHRNRSLSGLSAVAVTLALAACGGARQQQANAPMQPQPAPTNEYGAAMGQPAGAASGQPGQQDMPPPSPSATGPEQGGPYGGGAPTGPSGGQVGPTGETGPTGQGGETATQPGSTGGSMGSPSGMTGGTGSTSGMPGSAGAMGTPEQGGGSTDVSGLDDAQLAAIVHAINTGEMQAAQLAESKATSPQVKHFAREMATQHGQMEAKATTLFSRMQITPSDSPISSRLRSDAQGEVSMLHGTTGKDFDREYMDAQVRDHNQALELVDRMIPVAKNPELKTELQNLRAKIEGHLRLAERIQQTMQGAPGGQQKGTPNKQRGGGDNSNPY